MITKIFKFNKLNRKCCKLLKKVAYGLVYPWYIISENFELILKLLGILIIIGGLILFISAVIYSDYIMITHGRTLEGEWVAKGFQDVAVFFTFMLLLTGGLIGLGYIIYKLDKLIKKFVENYGRE